MASIRGYNPLTPPSFTGFLRLPKEIQSMIWSQAAPRRPRVIQLFYRPSTKTWHACGDSCGGLPSIFHVSREARSEALRGYTRAFDTYVDLEEDTVLISDPVFAIREPMKAFLAAEPVNKLRKIAIVSEVYEELEAYAVRFPTLCHWPSAILRMLENLTHFTLALSEDGETDVYDDRSEASTDGHETEGDEESHGSGIEDVETGPSSTSEQEARVGGPAAGTRVDSQETRRALRHLERSEREALAMMSKGYVRHIGNIRFESAMDSVDRWDDWDFWKLEITEEFSQEKEKHPEWVCPMVSIMVIKYGLKGLGDFSSPIHYRGDHSSIVIEGSEYPPDENESIEDEFDDGWDPYAI